MRISFGLSCASVALILASEIASPVHAVSLAAAATGQAEHIDAQNWTDSADSELQLAQTGAEAEAEMNFSRVAANNVQCLGQSMAQGSSGGGDKSKPQNVTIIDASRSIYGGSGGGKLAEQLKEILKPDKKPSLSSIGQNLGQERSRPRKGV